MDVQTVFYIMGIIFMSIMFIFMIALIVLLFYIKSKVTELDRNIREKIALASSVGQIGGKAVEVAVEKLKDMVDNKGKDKKSR